MADKSGNTEKPTQKRLRKAREEGNFPSARQFVSSLEFLAFVAVLSAWGGSWFEELRQATRLVLMQGFAPQFGAREFIVLVRTILWRCFLPLGIAGFVLLAVLLAGQLAVTNLGMSLKKLMPDPQRLNPMTRIRELPHQNLFSLAQAAVMMPVFAYAIYAISRDNLNAYFTLPLQDVQAAMQQVSASFKTLLWRAAGVFFLFGFVEFARERRRYTQNLMMSKQEIREEMKETEGNPQIKARIRRIQRELRRKRMMQAVPTATAVITNPTHYAIALRYEMETMAAPVVVAKGRDYLAQRIRQKAISHEVPIIENPPLARALYKSAEVGQEIPPHLYKAVAEILAYVYRLMHRSV